MLFYGEKGFLYSKRSVPDPVDGPVSVIAWVKGGAPGRVIVSHQSGADWLYLNQDGMLISDLNVSGQDVTSLSSNAFILDDQWHRVALVWDGTSRAFHMDGVEVVRDTPPSLETLYSMLYIGAGRHLGTTSYWSGLIDNVRIYTRAVQP